MRTLFVVLLMMSVPAFASPKLYVFDCGSITLGDVTMFGVKPEETPVRELFVPCYLIEHEKGKLLWDTGLAITAAGKGRVTLDGGSFIYERSIVDQLAAMHIAPRDLSVAFSHLHMDHAGGANALTEAKVLMQKAEWDSALAGNPEFDATQFDKLKNVPLTIIEGDTDVFGDGSVKLIYAPGHTPGHQALFVALKNFGPLVLSGDLYHFRISRTERRVPTFNFDAPMTLRSMDKVEAFIKETGSTLWIEHDKALADTLKKAPEYYD